MFKDFKSKTSLIMEEQTSRYTTGGGLQPGDYVVIRKDVLKNKKLEGRPSQFYDKIKEIINSDLPLKVGSIKSMRPETQHGLFGGAEAPSEYWIDVVQCANPALFVNPITLPIEVIDFVNPEGNNFSPAHPDNWSYDNKVIITPVKLVAVDKESLKQTDAHNPNKNIVTKHKKGDFVKEPKDGRDQVAKPKKYKESVDGDVDMLVEAYDEVRNS